jgi:hypothetical protein
MQKKNQKKRPMHYNQLQFSNKIMLSNHRVCFAKPGFGMIACAAAVFAYRRSSAAAKKAADLLFGGTIIWRKNPEKYPGLSGRLL